jgi:hypothetical protein
MNYVHVVIESALDQLTPTHRVRAIMVIAIGIMFPQMAHAQTNAIYAIVNTVGNTPQAAAPCTEASCEKLVPRYNKVTGMLGILEYNTATCTENTPGQWTGFPSTTSNNGQVSTGFASLQQGPPCKPSGSWTYAVMYFAWTAHNNHSTPSPSLVAGYPMDQFNATWSDPNTDGYKDSCGCTGPYTYTFNPYVVVVRPMGETSAFTGWADSRANWMQTLTPPKDDPSFDFSSEQVRELLTADSSTCHSAIGSMGSTSYSTPAAPWPVQTGNMWGPDQVGWAPCAVEYYRCVKATPCGYTQTQEMQIKSPADVGFTTYSGNSLSAGIDGSVLPFSNKTAWGNVTSLRLPAGSSGNPVSKLWVSRPTDCPANAQLPC